MIHLLIYFVILFTCSSSTAGLGLMLLYRPQDISKECALSRYLRFDLSYGMGMSDTITLVFRTLFDIDYECVIDLVAESDQVTLLIVVRYPTIIGLNCEVNRDAITVLNNNEYYRLCDNMEDQNSIRTIFPVTGRLRFRFISNSSVNTDINAYMYQMTATAAQPTVCKACCKRNETYCYVAKTHYCFTSGVVCDGINNCGLDDWFDERKALCNLPVEKLGYAPVIAVAAALLCTILAASHVLLRCLPPQANSFFIFNANEDNRLCIDPLVKPPDNVSPQPEKPRAMSLVPVFSSSSSGSEIEGKNNIDNLSEALKTFKSVGGSLKEYDTNPHWDSVVEHNRGLLNEITNYTNSLLCACCIEFGYIYKWAAAVIFGFCMLGCYLIDIKKWVKISAFKTNIEVPAPRRKITMRSMTAKLQEKFRSVTRNRSVFAAPSPDTLEIRTMNV